jgi:hypothetical protein
MRLNRSQGAVVNLIHTEIRITKCQIDRMLSEFIQNASIESFTPFGIFRFQIEHSDSRFDSAGPTEVTIM